LLGAAAVSLLLFAVSACSTAAVAVSLPLSLLLIRCRCCRFAAADRFFAVSPSNTKIIGVPPLLRTGSATVAVPVSLLLFALAVSKL